MAVSVTDGWLTGYPSRRSIERRRRLRSIVDREPKDFRVFDTDFKVAHTVGNYWPYATTLYDYIRRTMPLTAPGSLEPDETYAVIAYLLNANGIIADGEVIDAKSLPKVKMPGAGHFVPDNREGGPGFR